MTDKKMWVSLSLIIVVAGILMFSFLGMHPLMDPDEPVYAETAKEMLEFRDFVSPRIYGDFWYDKPPMYYWLVAASFKLFGFSEFSARFPSALFAVGGTVLVYLSGRKLFNERAGLLAALVLATSLEYFYLGNAAVTDMTLTFFLTAALLAFLHQKKYLLFAFAALATLTKGPVGIVFCGGIILLYQLLTGNIKTAIFKDRKMLGGLVIFLALTLPWYLLMYVFHGDIFVETFLGFHNITRFLQPEHVAGAVWYHYIPVLLLGFFPWSALMFQAFREGLREKGKERDTCLFLLIWAAVVFVFFSLSQTKLVSYILPLYPPLALMTGYYFDKIWREGRYRELKIAVAVFAAMTLLLCGGLAYAGNAVAAELAVITKAVAGLLALLVIVVLVQSFQRNFRAVFATQILGMMLFFTILMTQTVNLIAPELSVKQFVDEFNNYYDGQAEVYVMKFYRPGFAYYSGVAGKELKTEDVKTIIDDKSQRSYLIMKKKSYENLSPELREKLQLLVEQEDKVLLLHETRFLALLPPALTQ